MLLPSLPRHPTTAHPRGELLLHPPLDHRLPRHQQETDAVIKHRVAPAGEYNGTPVDAGHALPVGHGPMFQAGFGGYALSRLRELAPARRRQQVAREHGALPAMPDQSVHGPLLKGILHKCDHSAIYLLIAGSYTPFTFVTLRGPWGWSLSGGQTALSKGDDKPGKKLGRRQQ